VTEIYFGASVKAEDKADILAKAKAVNPKIAVFQAKRDKDGRIGFDKV
jgi:hypothetical protein